MILNISLFLQIIYVARNPKDVLVSYYHFSKMLVKIEQVDNFEKFMERFLAGKVFAQKLKYGRFLISLFLEIIYVARNLKNVLVSYYHFSHMSVKMEGIEDFDIFMERFLAVK
ncbi:hypothetical protein JD844_024385, partial [Phrynosoma platyrhinos]